MSGPFAVTDGWVRTDTTAVGYDNVTPEHYAYVGLDGGWFWVLTANTLEEDSIVSGTADTMEEAQAAVLAHRDDLTQDWESFIAERDDWKAKGSPANHPYWERIERSKLRRQLTATPLVTFGGAS